MSTVTLSEPISTCEDAIRVLDNIRTILNLQENHQLQTVTRSHPEIGFVLRDICGKPHLLAHKQVSIQVIEALMWFYRSHENGSLDTKANTWLSNQLGKCLQLPLAQANVVGACQWRWEEALQKIKLLITEALTNHSVLDDSTSIWVSQFGLILVHLHSKDSYFIGKLLKAFAQCPESLQTLPAVCAFFEAVSLKWKNGHLYLAPESKIHLWICHPPSLEGEMLAILEASADNPSSCIAVNWQARDLEKACHSSARILSSVARIICCLVIKTSFHPLVLELLYIVQQTLQQCSRELVLEAFPTQLHSAIVLLQVNHSGIPPACVPFHLGCICQALQTMTIDHPTSSDVIMLILLFPSWFSVALAQIGIDPTNQVANCVILQIRAILPEVKNSCLNRATTLVREVCSLTEKQAVDHVLTATTSNCCRGLALAMLFLRWAANSSPVTTVMPSTCSQLLAWCQTQSNSHKS